MGRRDSERIRMACTRYMSSIQSDDKLIPQLLDVFDHASSAEFARGAGRITAVAKEKDISHLRRIYGRVNGKIRLSVKVIPERVITRNPGLWPKRDLVLSVPVYPNESEFEFFLDSAIGTWTSGTKKTSSR